MPMAKSKKNQTKPKLNLTVRDEQRNKLEQMASLENRSVSNLIEVMADERWERFVEQQGVAYAKTVAEAMDPETATRTIQLFNRVGETVVRRLRINATGIYRHSSPCFHRRHGF